jgi:hypothetical protein
VIKLSQDALPKGTNIKKLRIDAAGYQASIIDYWFILCFGRLPLVLKKINNSNKLSQVTESHKI